MSDTILLGYWDIRGLAQFVRLLLEYTGTSYEEKTYSVGEAPLYDRSSWLNEKYTLGLDFPNLPYLVHGNRKLVQSNAIMRYIGRMHNMCGDTEEERIRADILEAQIVDFRAGFTIMCYTDYEGKKDAYFAKLPDTLKQFSDFLGDRKWFTGDKLNYVDFIAWEALDHQRMCFPTCMDQFPNLKAYMERFAALDKVAAYLKSGKFRNAPVNNKMAKWGYKPS